MSKASTTKLVDLLSNRDEWPTALNAAAVEALLRAGADVKARGDYKRTLLHLAVEAPSPASDPPCDLEVVRALIDAGADVNAVDKNGVTPLQLAAPSDRNERRDAHALKVMTLLREHGAVVRPHLDQWAASHYTDAAPEVYAILLEAGARVDARDERSGSTPLHSAASGGRSDTTRTLLAHGAQANVVDKKGSTPLALATRTRDEPWVAHNGRTAGFDETIALLKAAGGSTKVTLAKTSDPFAPLSIAPEILKRVAGAKKWPSTIRDAMEGDVSSVQDLVDRLDDGGEPDRGLELVRALGEALPVPDRRVVLKGNVKIEEAFFLKGDLEVTGNLEIRAHVAVTGGLTVGRVIEDCGPDSRVWIGGDVTCEGLNTDGELAVGGTLTARTLVLGYYNDNVLTAARICAPVVIEDDHGVVGTVEAEHHFDIDTYNRQDDVGDRLRAIFVPKVLEEDGRVDREAVFRELAAGRGVLASKAPSSKPSAKRAVTGAKKPGTKKRGR